MREEHVGNGEIKKNKIKMELWRICPKRNEVEQEGYSQKGKEQDQAIEWLNTGGKDRTSKVNEVV